ncbi:MAG: hypothetical protein JWR78_3041 [Mycobacterium sp.]|jgi:hypothetical protein|nr:hypothetical protein [Mycobacterium sp.]
MKEAFPVEIPVIGDAGLTGSKVVPMPGERGHAAL